MRKPYRGPEGPLFHGDACGMGVRRSPVFGGIGKRETFDPSPRGADLPLHDLDKPVEERPFQGRVVSREENAAFRLRVPFTVIHKIFLHL